MKSTGIYLNFAAGGHHADYLSYVIDNLLRVPRPDFRLVVAISRDLAREIAERIDLHTLTGHPNIVVHLLGDREVQRCRVADGWQVPACLAQARLVRHLAHDFQAQSVYCDQLNGLQVGLPLLRRQPEAAISGIIYHPYVRMRGGCTAKFADRLNRWRKVCQVRALLRCRSLGRAYVLNDPAGVRYLNRLPSVDNRFVSLPEPIRPAPTEVQSCRPRAIATLGLPADRVILAVVGVIKPRKGIGEILAGMRLLPTELLQRSCLVLAGPLDGYSVETWATIEQEARRNSPQLCLVTRFGWLDRERYELAIAAADCHLLLYTDAHGSSAVLGDAVRHDKGIIASRHGLMGRTVQRYQLGETVDPRSPDQVSAALARAIRHQQSPDSANAGRARYLEERGTDQFARIILDGLIGASPSRSPGQDSPRNL